MIKFNCFDDMPLNQDQMEVNKELRLVAEGEITENLLLFGGVGTGKSTLGHYLPRFYEAANGGKNPVVNLIECDAAFDLVPIRNFMGFVPWNHSHVDWIVLDEIDKIKPDRLTPLHSLLADNQDTHPAILIANRIDKIPEGILSRCHPLEIVAPRPEDYLAYAMKRLVAAGKQQDPNKVLNLLTGSIPNGADIRQYERIMRRLLR